MNILKFKNKLDTIASIQVLGGWSVVYAVILLCSLIYNSVFTFQFYDFSDLFINYQGGFVRRGLLGELFYWLYLRGLNPIYVAYGMSLLAYAVILGYMSHQFHQRGYAVGLLLVSFVLGGIGVFGMAFFRRDFIMFCLFLLTMFLRRKVSFGWWLICGNIITMIALLCHEPYMFWAYPLLCLVTHLHNQSWVKTILYWLPCLLVFILCLHFSGNEAQYLLIRQSTEPFLYFPNVMDFLSFDKGYVMNFHIGYNFLDSVYHIPNVIGSLASILIGMYYYTTSVSVYHTADFSRTDRISYSVIFMCVLICLLPMFTILSTDYTRTLMYAGLSSYIVFFELTAKECSRLFPPIIIRMVEKMTNCVDRLIPPTRFKIMFIVLFLSAVEWTGQGAFGVLRNSELGNSLMVVYKIVTKLLV